MGLFVIYAHSVFTPNDGRFPSPKKGKRSGDEQTLQQTYLPKEVQVAFKVLMTHWILQFA
jgi:hypothetical protein